MRLIKKDLLASFMTIVALVIVILIFNVNSSIAGRVYNEDAEKNDNSVVSDETLRSLGYVKRDVTSDSIFKFQDALLEVVYGNPKKDESDEYTDGEEVEEDYGLCDVSEETNNAFKDSIENDTIMDNQIFSLSKVLGTTNARTMSVEMKYDTKSGKFEDDDFKVIDKLEAAGVKNARALMEKAGNIVKQYLEKLSESNDFLYDSTIEVYCDGYFIRINDDAISGDGIMPVYMDIYYNLTNFYIPQQYKNTIDQIEQNTQYKLYASSTSSKYHYLTFKKNDSIYVSQTTDSLFDYDGDKNIDFMVKYVDGKLDKCQIISTYKDVKLTEDDNKFLNVVLGKSDVKLKRVDKTGTKYVFDVI